MEEIKNLKENLKNLKVMFVDDEKEIRDGTGMFLKKFFDDVTICENGKQGLEHYFENQDTEVVISDIIMPVMDGLEMITKIKELNPQVFVVFISASKDLKEVHAKSLCDICVKKPLSYDDTMEILHKIKEKQW